ncbi:hypothetical protein [Geobacter sulfurreducens]|uniref:hypothetical protein n=1 Tax=Geobacter sulfurreducens TaxID=35554 RepID=UPI000DBB79FE|nr:hypothetical protein [Geobacter sulfurreducens]BBA70055.1 hypothetical protein YM18_1520 [Geobacter sulfurreducens]
MTQPIETSPNHDLIRDRLRLSLDSARHDTATFAMLTVVLTPIFMVVGTIFLVFTLMIVDVPVVDHLGYDASVATGANLSLAFMAASYFLRPKQDYQRGRRGYPWLVVGASLFCVLLGISYGTTLPATAPGLFWSLYLVFALAMLGCIGHVYEPHDDYYVGWVAGPVLIDDPFTIEDDIDRAHLSLGLVGALSHLILSSYGEIFGSLWLWRGLKDHELSASVEFLKALAAKDPNRARTRMLSVGNASARDIMRALQKLEMILVVDGAPRLSMKGRELLGLKP